MMVASGVSYWDAFVPGLVMGLIAIGVLPWLDRNNTLARTIAVGACLLLGWRYMFWRITETLPPLSEPLDFSVGATFTLVELLAMIGTSLALIFLTRTKDRTPEANADLPWLKSLPEQPLVDVLICTYNEEEAILERTIIGALGIDYPRYRLWVCDDGRRRGSRICANAMAAATSPARTISTPRQATSIMRYCISRSCPSSRNSSPSSMPISLPRPQFLTRTVALMREADVGVVQTPQHFFNPDPIQTNLALVKVWPDEQRFFFDVVMASKDAWDGAFCCGTSSVLRFAPLARIGGFPTDSVTEDYLVSLAPARDRLPHRLSQRAAVARART